MLQTPVDRFYDALSAGDIAAARACYTPDARIWHCFDGLAETVDEATPAWEALVAHSRARAVFDVRHLPTDGGFVQRHMFVLTTPTGERKAWPVCLVVRIEGDRIARLEEYIDRAGSFAVGEGPVTMPGA